MTGQKRTVKNELQETAAPGGGGGGGTPADLYNFTASSPCLSGLGETTSQAELDYIAQKTAGGAIGVHVGGQMVTVAFENTDADAERTESAYRVFGEGLGMPVDDILSRDNNVVVLWERTPSASDAGRVSGCLKP